MNDELSERRASRAAKRVGDAAGFLPVAGAFALGMSGGDEAKAIEYLIELAASLEGES
jgi:hypothetical protein